MPTTLEKIITLKNELERLEEDKKNIQKKIFNINAEKDLLNIEASEIEKSEIYDLYFRQFENEEDKKLYKSKFGNWIPYKEIARINQIYKSIDDKENKLNKILESYKNINKLIDETNIKLRKKEYIQSEKVEKKMEKKIEKYNAIEPLYSKEINLSFIDLKKYGGKYNSLLHPIEAKKIASLYPDKIYKQTIILYHPKGTEKIEYIYNKRALNKTGLILLRTKFMVLEDGYWHGWKVEDFYESLMGLDVKINTPMAKFIIDVYDKIKYDKKDEHLQQNFKDNTDGTCVYDGLINYCKNKLKNKTCRNLKAILNKLINNKHIYAKSYTIEDLKILCEDLKISITIVNFTTGEKIEIGKSLTNKFNIEFINSKYNHLDILMHDYNNVVEVDNDIYEKIKNKSSFYVEKFGRLMTIDNTYKRKDTKFKLIYDKWFNDNNLGSCFITEDSNEYNLLTEYDYNMHRFFAEYNGNEEDYKEIDLVKAYYNYTDKNINPFYIGVPSGSFINHSCDNKFTIDTVKEQAKNKIVGFYQVKIIKHLKPVNDKLGFRINSLHVLYSSMIILLSDYIQFEFINASISPAIHIPFTPEFLESENINGVKKPLKHYAKAVGVMMCENSPVQIKIKPFEDDLEYYKTFHNENYNVFWDNNDLLNIEINNYEYKSYKHIAYSIHSYVNTLIINELLNIDFDNILGVKYDSIILKKSYNYDVKLKNSFSNKDAKLKNMFYDDLNFKYKDMTLGNYKDECTVYDFEFNKIFTPNGEYITKPILFFAGMGGTGKTHTIMNSGIPIKNICYTTTAWELIQDKTNENKGLIGLSIPKLTGINNNVKCQVVNNNNIKYICVDELTLQHKKEPEEIINKYQGKFIFLLGDIDLNGLSYQCSIYKDLYIPNENTQYIEFKKAYRFDEELNNRLLILRQYMKECNNNISMLKQHFYELFKDRIFNINKITYNNIDIGISSIDDTKRNNKLSTYFIEKGTKPKYYVKNTILQKNQLKGQEVFNIEEHNNYEMKLFKTIHSFQGRQLTQDNNIIVYIGNLFDYNLLYTAVSRARRIEQIYLFDKCI